MKDRDTYVQMMKEQMDRWNDDMERWEAKAKGARASMNERFTRELDVLKAQRELARYNLRLLEDASSGAWTELRNGADDAWARMRDATAAAARHFEKEGK